MVEEIMRSDPAREQREAYYHILAYLADNPDAGDTFEGIVEWWLLHQRIKYETRTVSEAVAKLIDEGLIQEEKGSDSRVVYRVHRGAHHVQNIQERLSQIRSSLGD
jgi:DNA-binding MarR family transcriptional regulator